MVGCGVVCVVYDTLKTPCMPAPRAHVFSTCARGAGINEGSFECIHGGGAREEGRGEGRGGEGETVRRQPRVFQR